MTENSFIRVSDVMSPNVKTIGRVATIAEAIEMIKEEKVSSLIVERHDEGDEFGMLTIRDIAREVVATDRPAGRTSVYEVMRKPVMTVPAEMNIKYAVRLLVRFSLSRAVVIDHDRNPVGIVTLRDMVLGYSE
ncbi:putative signal-transduction protein with CBS domains [Candidatus Terasakiella magnetica]|uniref:Putative signal-transduction protein with CBS domains n=1 Tax=Candidatus Terasakiella magnetica TaxID=1867952 RepID=A0A1C3RCL2_9PROT|nr:CBS domain-containing protein [Candidatus Terasakiella magnetica]SCA55013.1 putative signal-transduction protein with CBS domains [Candidatus Terasakiella magnetica]